MRTIGQISKASGVSERALRYYEDLGILSPKRTEAGYRMYSAADERRLAQIVAMRRCELPLTTICTLLSTPDADIHAALSAHLRTLRAQGRSVDAAMRRTQAALHAIERMNGMSTQDAFEKMKAEGLESFEEEYGQEARERYGSGAIDKANERMMSLTKDEWDAKELLEESVKVQLRVAIATGDPLSPESRELAHMHERWIAIHWGKGYKNEEYLGLVRGYLDDSRFISYYDSAAGDGATEFLVRAIEAYQGGEHSEI